MKKQIGALVLIFIFATFAWFTLGGMTALRTETANTGQRKLVGELWGTRLIQRAPNIYKQWEEKDKKGKVINTHTEDLKFETTDIDVKINYKPRKKGLLWYSTYDVEFDGKYLVTNDTKNKQTVYLQYTFPTKNGVYDNFFISEDGKNIQDINPSGNILKVNTTISPGKSKTFEVTYKTQGMDDYLYKNSSGVSQLKNFTMKINTNFDDIDFPNNTISPTDKKKTKEGWETEWKYKSLISSVDMGITMPEKINPGPFISKITLFAPISLFIFMFLTLIISVVKKVKIHPMHYFFITAAFFSFHLLMAYLADHVDINMAFIISAATSLFLVISYMVSIVGTKYALIEIGLAQLVYLVLFSYAFFFKGFTGLTITITCILTLFIVMQATKKVDWEKIFNPPV